MDIRIHLESCGPSFIPPLSTYVNISDYARRLADRAFTLEYWHNNILIALVAMYMNDTKERIAFISNISTLSNYQGQGLASDLLHKAIAHARDLGFTQVALEVNELNTPAIKLYERNAFVRVAAMDGRWTMHLTLTL
ncbi:MAG: GNAT family N-acetyltransferase [Flavobacteriales bacterium]